MEVNTAKPRSPLRHFNKYIEYRRQYERSKDRSFSKHLEDSPSSKTKTTPEEGTETSGKSLASAEDSPKQNPLNESPASTQSLPDYSSPSEQVSATPIPPGKSQRMLSKLQQYEPHIKAAAARYNLPEELIAGVIWQESRGNPRAVSHCGAMGLMQLMPGTARHLGVSNAFNERQNIDGGAKYLRQMLDKFGRVDFAVAAYNAGPGNVSRYGGIPPFKETRNYVPKVLGYANGFQLAGGFPQSRPPTAVRV